MTYIISFLNTGSMTFSQFISRHPADDIRRLWIWFKHNTLFANLIYELVRCVCWKSITLISLQVADSTPSIILTETLRDVTKDRLKNRHRNYVHCHLYETCVLKVQWYVITVHMSKNPPMFINIIWHWHLSVSEKIERYMS